MIQRIQSLYLFINVILSIIVLVLPVATVGQTEVGNEKIYLGTGDVLFYILLLTCLLNLAGILLFKNRKRQLIMVAFALIAAVSCGIAYLLFKGNSAENIGALSFSFTIIFPAVMILFNYLAILGIRKDERLIRSMDRLR